MSLPHPCAAPTKSTLSLQTLGGLSPGVPAGRRSSSPSGPLIPELGETWFNSGGRMDGPHGGIKDCFSHGGKTIGMQSEPGWSWGHPSEGKTARGVSPHTPPKAKQREECPHTPLRRQSSERSVPTHPSEGKTARGVSPHTPPKAKQREECPHTPLRRQSSERSVPTSEGARRRGREPSASEDEGETPAAYAAGGGAEPH